MQVSNGWLSCIVCGGRQKSILRFSLQTLLIRVGSGSRAHLKLKLKVSLPLHLSENALLATS